MFVVAKASLRTKVSDGPMGKSWLAKKGGWTKVEVGDDLLNSDEFGFVELEQLDASELGEGRRGRGRSVLVVCLPVRLDAMVVVYPYFEDEDVLKSCVECRQDPSRRRGRRQRH